MRRVVSVIAAFLFLFMSAEKASAKSIFFIGGNLGYDTVSGGGDTVAEPEGILYGATIKYFPDNKKSIGFGATYNIAVKEDSAASYYNVEETLSVLTADLMYNFSDGPSAIYALASVGFVEENLREVNYGYEASADTGIYGLGLGMIYKGSEPGFKIGGEAKYLRFSDSDNADGLIEAYITLGYAF